MGEAANGAIVVFLHVLMLALNFDAIFCNKVALIIRGYKVLQPAVRRAMACNGVQWRAMACNGG